VSCARPTRFALATIPADRNGFEEWLIDRRPRRRSLLHGWL